MHPLTSHFQQNFDENDLSIISNPCDDNDPYTLSTHKWKMCEENALYFIKDKKNLTKFD